MQYKISEREETLELEVVCTHTYILILVSRKRTTLSCDDDTRATHSSYRAKHAIENTSEEIPRRDPQSGRIATTLSGRR